MSEDREKKTCKTCKWWDNLPIEHSDDGKLVKQGSLVSSDKYRSGLCRYNPCPSASWPMTYERDWCARHQDQDAY